MHLPHATQQLGRLPTADELTSTEFASLMLVSKGFMSKTAIPKPHQARLLELGLIQVSMGGVMATPAGRMVARIQVGG